MAGMKPGGSICDPPAGAGSQTSAILGNPPHPAATQRGRPLTQSRSLSMFHGRAGVRGGETPREESHSWEEAAATAAGGTWAWSQEARGEIPALSLTGNIFEPQFPLL